MNNRVGINILGILLFAAVIFSVVQLQNLNKSQSQITALERTITGQADDFANQVTSDAATLNAAVTLGAENVAIAQQMALTQQVQVISTGKAQATATLGSIIEQAATVQAQAITDAQDAASTRQSQAIASEKAQITATLEGMIAENTTAQANAIADVQATLSIMRTQLADANVQLATLQASPSPTATIEPTSQNSSSDIQLGTLVTTGSLDRNGCATESQSIFAPDQDIYVVAPNSKIPSGTSLFVRLYHEDTPIEDAPEITADRDYSDICINYVFQPTGADFVTGNYKAQFFINGNEGPSIELKVSK